MNSFILLLRQSFIDFIFTPSQKALELRGISAIDLLSKFRKPTPISIFPYRESLIRELIWQIKYKKDKHSIECASYALYNELKLKYPNGATLIPIPISKNRRKERGYNQCELLIDEIIKLDTEKETGGKFVKNFNLLFRIKDIEKQTLKNRSERLVNVKNIFEVRDKIQIGNNIIIIDDVTTTGSTLNEARKTLIEAGYLDVGCLTIAH